MRISRSPYLRISLQKRDTVCTYRVKMSEEAAFFLSFFFFFPTVIRLSARLIGQRDVLLSRCYTSSSVCLCMCVCVCVSIYVCVCASGYYTAVLMICVVSWAERTACCGTGCSRPGSARNGLQVRVSIGTQCSHQRRRRYSYSTAGTLCYFVASFQDLPLHFTLNALPQLLSLSLPLCLSLCLSLSSPCHCHFLKSRDPCGYFTGTFITRGGCEG